MPTGIGTATLIAGLAGAGASVGGAALASRGQSQAADKQAEAIQKGIDLQREMYQQDRADFAPYRGLGAGAVGNLAYLSGITLPAASADPAKPAMPQQPGPITLSQLGITNPNSPTGKLATPVVTQVNAAYDKMNAGELGPTIKVRAKNGQERVIPASLLPKAMQLGYTQVNG